MTSSPTRPRRVRRTPEQARTAILDAAEALLRDRSFSALRIEEIMQVAGMTRPAFYHYYPDLAALAGGLL
ncbi:MAG: helix-turn-helix domain-containing protein, partial [Pseudomonadota bacterium]